MEMKILITGATGMLGRSILKHFTEINNDDSNNAYQYKCLGTGMSRVQDGDGLIKLDLLDEPSVSQTLDKFQPEIIIHCAAERFPDKVALDPVRTTKLNVDSTAFLSKECCRIQATMIYISTDYVFDGGVNTGVFPPYKPDSVTGPVNDYGLSKLAGEEAVLASKEGASSSHIIVRVPVLYALDCESLDESASLTVANALKKKKSDDGNDKKAAKVDNWGVRFPTLVDDIARCIRLIVDHSIATTQNSDGKCNVEGGTIFHVSSPQSCTKYELLKIMGDILKVDSSHIEPDPEPPAGAPRPQNTQMDCSQTWSILNPTEEFQFTPLREGMDLALRRFKSTEAKSRSRRWKFC